MCFQAGGGMGKSTFTKHLASDWAEGKVAELNKFQFMFHMALKNVKDNSSIENIIIAQHSGLKANRVQPAEIKSILGGNNKVLLLIDGHDEYKTGRNTDIDEAIKKESLWKCWMILTSRKTDVKNFMDAEVEIHGFQGNDVIKFMTQSLGNEQKTRQLVEEAASKGLCNSLGQGGFDFRFSLLTIPFLLNMVCFLFNFKMTLPKTTTGIMDAVVNRCLDREAIRAKGKKAVESAKRVLLRLGKLAWQGLMERNQFFEKVSLKSHVITASKQY